MEDAINLLARELHFLEREQSGSELTWGQVLVVILVKGSEVLLIGQDRMTLRHVLQFSLERSNYEFETLISPDERGYLLAGVFLLLSRLKRLVHNETKTQDMFLEFIEADATVEVLVHLSHELEHLLLSDGEAHAFKRLVELVDLDQLILVEINLIEHFL